MFDQHVSGTKTPSANNKPPWHFTVITDTNISSKFTKATVEGTTTILISGLSKSDYSEFDCALATQNMYIISQSMSRRGNCWDNSPQESFFGHFKDEVDYKNSVSLNNLICKINHYLVYYNNYRYQWNLKKMTPIQFE
jgi:hypothetical protein